MEWKLEIAGHFHPELNQWSGFAVIMGVKGSHENYDVIYNGECVNEYFDTERKAKVAAWRESKNHKHKMQIKSRWL